MSGGSTESARPASAGDDGRERSEELLAGLKDLMSANNANNATALCLVIAAKLIGDGISALAG